MKKEVVLRLEYWGFSYPPKYHKIFVEQKQMINTIFILKNNINKKVLIINTKEKEDDDIIIV